MLPELRAALRRLRARRWHAAAVVAIFALGSGAALTVYRVADAVLLRALPYRGADRIVRVATRLPILPTQSLPYSDVGYRALEGRNRSFEAIAGYRVVGVNLTRGDTPERVTSVRVTGTFFDVLGLPVRLGRGFAPGEEGARNAPVVVLSDALWRARFGADPAAVGSTVRVDGAPATVVGVADPRVAFPAADAGYFTLMDLDPVGTAPFDLGIEVVARLRPGVSPAAGAADASRIVREVARENPSPHASPDSDLSGYRAELRLLRDDVAGGVGPTLALLGVAVALVLCLACVNVATLELVRSSARRGELAVRAALGADRTRLVAGALAEGALLALAGVSLGLAASALAARALDTLFPAAVGVGDAGVLTRGVLLSAAAMVAACAAASGAFPVAVSLGRDLQSALRGRAATATRRAARLRRALLAAQVAFACVLVDGAALMAVTVRGAQRVALGFRPEGVVVFQLSLPPATYAGRAEVAAAYGTLVERLRAIPGVGHVAVSTSVPLDARRDDVLIGVEGRAFRADGTDPGADYRLVSPGYLDALGIPLRAGRLFRDGDRYLDGTPVLISERLAALLFPDGRDPLGKRIRVGPYAPWMPIVGVVGDAKNRALTLPPRPEMYLPYDAPRSPMRLARDMAVVIRATGSPAAVQAAAQRIVRHTNPDLPVYGFRRLDDVVRRSQAREITTMRALGGLAAAALALAVVGSYAMLSFTVLQRRRELAVRGAMGAPAGRLAGLVGRELGKVLLFGIGAGLVGTVLLSRALSRFLFGVGALDPRVTAATVAVVAAAGVAAAARPALRARAADLMLVLRAE